GWVAATAWIAGAGTSIASLLAARAALGVAEAPTFPAAAQAVSRWMKPGQRGRADGLVVAAIGLGSAIAPPLVSFVMVRWGWRTALLVSAVPALAVGLAWLAVRAPEASVQATVKRDLWRGLPKSRSLVLLT